MSQDVLRVKELHVCNAEVGSEDVSAGSLKDSGAADILCDARLKIVLSDGTVYYAALYDTTV